MEYKLIFNMAPGDCWALTCLIRDFAEQHPEHILEPVTGYPEIFEGNPFFRKAGRQADELVFKFGEEGRKYTYGNRKKTDSMAGCMYDFIRQKTGLLVERKVMAPEIYLTEKERRYSMIPLDKPVCIVNAGWKADVPVKFWGRENFQTVVDALLQKVTFVQVGAIRQGFDHHEALNGAVDLRGRTSLRELAWLVYHADFVLTGISQLHHLAGIPAYKERHCITIAGGREPENWANCYRREKVTWHWIGRAPFGECPEKDPEYHDSPGCWQSACVPEGEPAPCMKSIKPEEVIAVIRQVADKLPANEKTIPVSILEVLSPHVLEGKNVQCGEWIDPEEIRCANIQISMGANLSRTRMLYPVKGEL